MTGKRFFAALFIIPAIADGQSFDTTVTNYVYVGAAGLNNATNPTMIYTAASPTGTAFTYLATITGASAKINGVGLNRHDGYLYGITFPDSAASPSSKLYRIGTDGVAKQVATLMAPATGDPISVVNTTAGLIDDDGNYIFTAYTYSGNPYVTPYTLSNFKFYVGKVTGVKQFPLGATQRTPSYIQADFSDTAITAAFQSFVTNFNYANPGASNGGMEDVAISPLNGKLYSYLSYPNPADPSQLEHRPVVLDFDGASSTYKIHPVGTTINNSPNREIAGAYFDPSGNYYVIFTDATYAQVNLVTGALMNVVAANVPLSGNNLRGDLASNLTSPIATPVVLARFTGIMVNGAAQLAWASGVEHNLKQYAIEKSTDGISFTTAGTVAATGSNSTYTFADALNGIAWYRLLLQDNNGSHAYSAAIKLSSEAITVIHIYPTSVAAEGFTVMAPAGTVIRVYDITGKQTGNTITTSGENTLTQVPLTAMPGLYEVQITDGQNGMLLATQRIVRQ